jgi:hypothetical protein
MFDSTVTGNGHSGVSRSQPAWVGSLAGMPGLALAFLWGLAEGTFFFVVPDVPISLVALLKPRCAGRHILAAIVGSAIGGMLLFSWSARDPRGAREAVARVPFVTSGMFAEVHASYRTHGLGALFLGPLSGTPYKIYAVEAPEFLGGAALLLATVPARGERFLVVWAAFGVAGALLRRFRGRTAPQLALLDGSFWVVLYAFYWSMIVFR